MKHARPFRDRWRDDVLAHGISKDRKPSQVLSERLKLFCLVLADDMTAEGVVSVPRVRLAAKMGLSEKSVTDRFRQAVDAGVLQRLSAGVRGHTAVYAARAVPSVVERPVSTETRHTTPPVSGTTSLPAKSGDSGTTPPDNQSGTTSLPANCRNVERESGTTSGAASSTSPQRFGVSHSDAVAALAAQHPSTNSQSAFSSRSPSGEPPKAELPKQDRSDDEYAAARQVLDRLAPDRRDALMARAFKTLGNVSNRDLICYAADTARAVGEVA